MARNVRYVHKHGNSLVVAVPIRLRRALKLEPGTPILWSMPEPGLLQFRNISREMKKIEAGG